VTGLGARGVSLRVRPGEILGLTGLSGSGYADLPYLLSGVSKADAGTITLPGRAAISLRGLQPATAIKSGIALVPEGREEAGLAVAMTVTENLSFPQTCARSRKAQPLKSGAEKALASDWIGRLDVRPPDGGAVVKTLSGGNQQKVLLAKWLATGPSLLVLHEPTQAVDVGARTTIARAVREAARQGCAVIVAGSDENELSLLCDRILVFRDGTVQRELTGDLTPREIVHAIYAGAARSKLRQRPTTNHRPHHGPLTTTDLGTSTDH
jgi:ribose transport system ATP-binding protein